MAEWSKDHVVAIGPFLNSNSGLVDRFLTNWRLGGALRWKGKDHRLGRSESGVWKADIFMVVALTCVN
jgi:hypothetical protein